MKNLLKSLAVLAAISSTTLFAGSGHSHDGEHGHSHTLVKVSEKKVKQTAKRELQGLIKRAKIDKSWSSIEAQSMEKKSFDGKMEWVVVFMNKSVKDVKKQKLHIFVTEYGEVTGANYSGK
ncbi:MAG: DUF6488 family protein [Sulfurimonas sp.]|jgi:hypothetical protein